MTFLELAKMTENQARKYLEKIRWSDGKPVCPHCDSDNCTRLKGKKHRRGAIQCNECRQQFSVTVNTVMEKSHIPLTKWLMAIHLMCSSKKGISARQLQRDLDLGSYKSAHFLSHRVRYAMEHGILGEKLKGVVEADETFVGGKSRKGKRGYSSERKTPVLVMVERDGKAIAKVVKRTDGNTLKPELMKHIDKSATLMTDEAGQYYGLSQHFDGGHHAVVHSRKEYSRGNVHSNTAESFFSLIKRGYYGVFHWMSKQHLHRYVTEFQFRWNHRKQTDSECRDAVLKQLADKRLMYYAPKSGEMVDCLVN